MISFIAKYHLTETQFYQPNLSRSRQALRSPRSSERINLEVSQFLFDIYKLYEKVLAAESTLDDDFETMNEGDTTVYQITMSGDATPSSVKIPSLESIALRFEAFNKRLEVIEKGLV